MKCSLSVCKSTILLIFAASYSIYGQFDKIIQQYDVITTIAGKGDIDDKAVNGWKAEFESGPAVNAELSRPHFVMADKNGEIYIADKDAHAIRKISLDGRIYTVAGTNVSGYDGDGIATAHQLSSPNGLWVKGDGTLYILDLGNSRIRKVTPAGDMNTLIHDPGGISIGRGLWVSEDEKAVYYSSGRTVKKWTPSDGITTVADGFSQLGNLIVDPTGDLAVTDRGANLVYRISADGSKTIIAGDGESSNGGSGFKATETSVFGVRGIWFLADNSYFLATHEGSQIWYVDKDGFIHLFLDGKEGDDYHGGDGEHFQTPGYKISEARSVSIDYEGNILIAENDRGFIRKIAVKQDSQVNVQNDRTASVSIIAFPNPFNDSTTISYFLPVGSHVSLQLFNFQGQMINTLVSEEKAAGYHSVDFASALPSGIYFCRLKIDDFVRVQKITLSR